MIAVSNLLGRGSSCSFSVSTVSLLLLLTAACSTKRERDLALDGVDRFHFQFNSADFASIYRSSTPAYQRTTSSASSRQFYEQLFKKSGQARTWQKIDVQVNGVRHRTYGIRCLTTFDNARALETFLFVVNDDEAKLESYHIEGRPSTPKIAQ